MINKIILVLISYTKIRHVSIPYLPSLTLPSCLRGRRVREEGSFEERGGRGMRSIPF
jgi:hypothetical protein